jgi:hypothetical protein
MWLLLGILGVWRVTHLLHAEDGPADLFVHVRRLVGIGFWGSVLDCFYCLSLWIAVPFALMLATSVREALLAWPALSGGAILLERLTARAEQMPPAVPLGEGDDHVMLRREAGEHVVDAST